MTGLYKGKLPMYQRAHELGVKLVMLDGPGHWTKSYVEKGLFEVFIEVDLKDDGNRLERALDAIDASGLHFDGVATFNEFANVLTAQIAQKLGLPGHPVESVKEARNKFETRRVCAAAGLDTPRYALINSPADLAFAAETVGFPAVLKPVAGAASIDAYRVDNLQMLEQRYQQVMNAQANAVQYDQLNSNGETVPAFVWLNGVEMIMEEFLDGDEFDIDCLLSNGQMMFYSVTSEDPQPYMIETSSALPAKYPADKQAELVELARNVLRTMQFTDGVFHVEAKYTSRGPRLLEVNARLGGGTVYPMVKRVWGVDLVEQYLLTCIGVAIEPRKSPVPLTYLAVYDIQPQSSGILMRDDFMDHLQHDPRVEWITYNVRAGQRVVGPEEGVPETLGQIAVNGDSAEAADRKLEAALATIKPVLSKRC